jgi:hypothetical protein
MRLSRLAARLLGLAVAAVIVLPFAIERIEAFGGDAADRPAFASSEGTASSTTASDTGGTLRDKGARPPADRGDASPPTTDRARRRAAAPSPAATVLFDGRVTRADSRHPRWVITNIAVSKTGAGDFVLGWTGDGMLRMSIRELDSKRWVASDASERNPKTVTAKLTAGVTYRVAVWTIRGSGSFELSSTSPSVTVLEEAPQDQEVQPTTTTTAPPASTTTTTAPVRTTTTTTTTTTKPPPRSLGSGYPGEPANGTLLWGSSITGNGDPVARHEKPAGHPLTVRRTFWQWDQRTGSMVDTARGDISHGRVPWVSVKPPSWSATAAGDHDSEIDAMLKALDALSGPVWLTIHHEPEGGGGVNSPDDPGGPAAHVAMNRQVRERMTALGTDNIALAPVLMSWSWNSASGRNPDAWWEPGIYDFIGVDHYQDSESSLLTTTWFKVRSWAAARGVDVAVGEWGMRGTDKAAGNRVREWYEHAAGSHSDGRGARVVGLSAFDSGLNSPTGTWELKGAQLATFHNLLADKRTANP